MELEASRTQKLASGVRIQGKMFQRFTSQVEYFLYFTGVGAFHLQFISFILLGRGKRGALQCSCALFYFCNVLLIRLLFSKTLLKGKGPRLVKEISLKLTTYAADQMVILFIGNLVSP